MTTINHNRKPFHGFTLVELLMSMAVLSILMLVISEVISETQQAWRQTASKVSQFRDARKAFDTMKRNLSQATLNTYVTYRFNNGNDPFSPFTASGDLLNDTTPSEYVRYSELQFVCGPFGGLFSNGVAAAADMNVTSHGVFFQAPLGFSSQYANMPTALNPRGYFVSFGGDANYRPSFLNSRIPEKFRYRLMEYSPATEQNKIYDETTRGNQSDWFADCTDPVISRPIVDNVVALYFAPRRPLEENDTGDARGIAPQYGYNTAVDPPTAVNPKEQFNQLPPLLDIVMVVLDESSASAIADRAGNAPPFTLPDVWRDARGTGFEEAIDQIEQYLVNYPTRPNFRIFTTTVAMKNSKWGL